MFLDLREIIDVPGGKVSFDYEPDFTDILNDYIKLYIKPPKATGNVLNRAGMLILTADVDLICECICFRCASEFDLPVHKHITATLAEDEGEQQDSDNYFFTGDKIDLDEIIRTEFLLNTEERFLCREDCAGLCQKCGKDLNLDSCTCSKDIDPRLAKLSKLLELEQEQEGDE